MADSELNWLNEIIDAAPVEALGEALGRSRAVVADGSRGSSTALLAGGLALRLRRPVLLVVAHLDEADDAMDDLELLAKAGHTLRVSRFGALEVLPGESAVSLELLAERLGVVGELSRGRQPDVLIAPIQALMQPVPRAEAMARFALDLQVGQELPPARLMDWLASAGYQRQDGIEQPGDFAVRGGIIDIFPPAGSMTGPDGEPVTAAPIRLDYFGDEIDTIHRVDPDSMGSKGSLQAVRLIGADAGQIQNDADQGNVLDLLSPDTVPVLHEVLELSEQARGYYERLTRPEGISSPHTVMHKLTHKFRYVQVNQYAGKLDPDLPHVPIPVRPLPEFHQDAREAVKHLVEVSSEYRTTVLCGKPAEKTRLAELLEEHGGEAAKRITLDVAFLHRGFVWEGEEAERRRDKETKWEDRASDTSSLRLSVSSSLPLLLLPHHELFHRYETRRRVRRVVTDATAQASDAFLDLEVGDYVVHVDHGIAQFVGLKTLRRKGETGEYLTLQFAGEALLHVPATQIDLVQKYIGGFEGRPPLSTLGGKRWDRQKQSVAEAVRDLAKELLRVQAAREVQPGIRYPKDTAWQREFEAEFPYDETEDQLAAIAAIKQDMTEPRPMDRLICGDVGFGKTEVAIRGAFKAIEYGKQVAVLVPTTVLAEQHTATFRARMADYPFRVESLSRFRTAAEQKKVLKELQLGQVDIIIGTHRLLSKDVKFADLGLVIIDEEQRFGVEHKNKLLEFRLTVDVLTLTATPIPRTLHMSMIGLRDISSLSTAPVDRRAIVTEVIPFDRKRIKNAVIRELNRDGQIYFVHNRVHNIQSIADDIQQLVPDARIIIGHGQMPPRELEQVMLKFVRHEADILVSTTIIESGIDIPTANTMFINQADHFGLAELHQLRGRVGRYKHRAYCYMLLPGDRPVNETAAKRLKAIEQYSMLGAGFKIAMRDLEIRGAGNLLGAEQSGHIATVGYEMYCLLLEKATKKLKGESIIEPTRTHLELPVQGALPKRYVPSDKFRMEAYRRLSRATTLKDLEEVVQSMADAYGPPPPAAQSLLDLAELRIAASTLGVDSLKLEDRDLIFEVSKAAQLQDVFADAPGRVTVVDEKTLYYRPPEQYLDPPSTLLAVLRKLLVRPVRQRQAATDSPAVEAGRPS